MWMYLWIKRLQLVSDRLGESISQNNTNNSPRSRTGRVVRSLQFETVAVDPLDPPKRYHTGVFVERDTVDL